MPAIQLLTMQAALGGTPAVPLTWDGASVWHCQVGMEHTCGIARWAWSTHVALLGGHGAHVALVDKAGAHEWHCQMGMEHRGGTSGQNGTTCIALMDRQKTQVWQ